FVAAMRTLTVPPSQDEVAQAADEVSGGAIARVRVESWPRGRSHHAYLLTTPGGEQFLFKVHRRPHPGRMRRFLHLAELLQEKHVPHAAVRWSDVDKRTLEVDRKSTRLNSSHDQISYAVFCLKKKKIKR